MDWFDKAISILFSASILANAFIIRKVIGVWLFPACIYSLFWFVMTLVPLIVGFGIPINPLAVGFIALTSYVFTLGSLSFDWKRAFEINAFKPLPYNIFVNRFMRLTLYFFSAVAVASVLVQVLSQGFSFADLYTNMFDVAGTYANNRYSGDIEATIFSRLGLSSAYISVLVGGLYFGALGANRKRWVIFFISFFPATLVMLLQSAKGLLFLSLALFVACIFVTRIYSRNYSIASRTDMFAGLSIFVLITPLVTISFLSRGLYQNNSADVVFQRLVKYLVSYSSAHIYTFSDWFSNYIGETSLLSYTNNSLTYGFFTFMSFFRALGDNRYVPAGTYDNFFSYGNFMTSNIYTAFRGAILDFGLVGSLVVIYFSSFSMHLVYHFLLRTKKPCISIALFVLSIGAIYMSYLVSIFTWNVIPFVFLVFSFILFINGTKLSLK